MKTTLIIISLLIVAAIILLFILGIMSKSGKANGLVEGNLSRCSDKPNCVCSEYKDDSQHYINPLIIPDNNTDDALAILKTIVREMDGKIQNESDRYFSASFSSALFGFVDDLEVRLDSKKHIIHLRSASRVGYSDRGVNKKRIKLIKKRFNQTISKA